ncbi:MAG: hypothetical protein KTR18_14200 [Acidiferrobacterales bacterium]|nr:hypothetical protein [Acidiferrobacterales bacterium]
MFNRILKIVAPAIVAGMFSSVAFAMDEYSQPRDVARLQVVATSEATYITASPSGWGASQCPGATYILITNSGGQYKTQLALAMTAKAAGLKLSAFGECDPSGVYFNAKQLLLQ